MDAAEYNKLPIELPFWDQENGLLKMWALYNTERGRFVAWNPELENDEKFVGPQPIVIRRVQPHAQNVRMILEAFQFEGWPIDGIYDPLPYTPRKKAVERLKSTIKQLNGGNFYCGLSDLKFHTENGPAENSAFELMTRV
jgi:hypothetical protein